METCRSRRRNTGQIGQNEYVASGVTTPPSAKPRQPSQERDKDRDKEPPASRPMLMSIENLGPTTRRCPATPVQLSPNISLPSTCSTSRRPTPTSTPAPPLHPSFFYNTGGRINSQTGITLAMPMTPHLYPAANYASVKPFHPTTAPLAQFHQTPVVLDTKLNAKPMTSPMKIDASSVDERTGLGSSPALHNSEKDKDFKPIRSISSSKSLDKTNWNTVTVPPTPHQHSGFNYDYGMTPPPPYAWARYSSPNQERTCFPLKPQNFGAYPRLPGQRDEDPPCFSTTLPHRSLPLASALPSTTTSTSYFPPPRKSSYSDTSVVPSFGGLGDCNNYRLPNGSTLINNNSYKSTRNRPSDCGDDLGYSEY